jgi:hypothetical protein
VEAPRSPALEAARFLLIVAAQLGLLPAVARRLPRPDDPPLAGDTPPLFVTVPVTERADPFPT